jgi:hypothetical protein
MSTTKRFLIFLSSLGLCNCLGNFGGTPAGMRDVTGQLRGDALAIPLDNPVVVAESSDHRVFVTHVMSDGSFRLQLPTNVSYRLTLANSTPVSSARGGYLAVANINWPLASGASRWATLRDGAPLILGGVWKRGTMPQGVVPYCAGSCSSGSGGSASGGYGSGGSDSASGSNEASSDDGCHEDDKAHCDTSANDDDDCDHEAKDSDGCDKDDDADSHDHQCDQDTGDKDSSDGDHEGDDDGHNCGCASADGGAGGASGQPGAGGGTSGSGGPCSVNSDCSGGLSCVNSTCTTMSPPVK